MMSTPTAAECPPVEWVEWTCETKEKAYWACRSGRHANLESRGPSLLDRNILTAPHERGFF